MLGVLAQPDISDAVALLEAKSGRALPWACGGYGCTCTGGGTGGGGKGECREEEVEVADVREGSPSSGSGCGLEKLDPDHEQAFSCCADMRGKLSGR